MAERLNGGGGVVADFEIGRDGGGGVVFTGGWR